MDKRNGLDELLRATPLLWRGRRPQAADSAAIPTGFTELDKALPGSGWPFAALMEIAVPAWGIGELHLLLPAMRHVQQSGKRLAWIAPPYLPYAPALADAGIDLDRLLLLDKLSDDKDIWWSAEKLLRSTACGMVLAWPRKLSPVPVLRRLQLAATEGRCLGVLLLSELPAGTPAALRLRLEAGEQGLWVHILKTRGTPIVNAVLLGGSDDMPPN
ncbi:translesion DNA synthesis-associated protein ImuA [Methylocaldum sp.]|uniref:translesion DNA synthesis-associated protein ImuA n=1 Tax=Methylocaldum sp. TaxID=1969727 RepID=UPI002D4D7A9D|nr:translesion DNA synthesis-associated protein ImuA [Methylocaldum sp.]HYE37664.1 translesion DNA synthesis-associated protein ImuA [Methylocaldum sp.]